MFNLKCSLYSTNASFPSLHRFLSFRICSDPDVLYTHSFSPHISFLDFPFGKENTPQCVCAQSNDLSFSEDEMKGNTEEYKTNASAHKISITTQSHTLRMYPYPVLLRICFVQFCFVLGLMFLLHHPAKGNIIK